MAIYGVKKTIDIIRDNPEQKMIVALSGAFIFLMSSLKLPSVSGSSSHPTFAPKVADDIAFGPRNLGLSAQEVDERVDEALYLTGIESLRNRSVMQISYGQRKRVTLDGALAMHPKVLIMDEPTAGLDPQMSKEIMELADELHHNGTTIIISTHDMDLSYSWADEIHVLRGGRNIYSGDSEGFYDDTSEVYMSGLVEPAIYNMNVSISQLTGGQAEPHPKTLPQLVAKSVPSEHPGTVNILSMDERIIDEKMFTSIINATGSSVTGVHGTKARKAVQASKLPIDFFSKRMKVASLNRCTVIIS